MDFIFDPSLVLYLPLYELDGASFMSKDAYGHACTVTGALWRPNGRYFDGSDDYIDFSSTVLPLGAKSVFAWIKLDPTSAFTTIFDQCEGSSTKNGITFGVTDAGCVYVILNDGATVFSTNGSGVGTVDDSIWHLVGFTWDGTTTANMVKVYIDGALDHTGTAARTESSAASNNLRMGSLASVKANDFLGYMGEAWAYGRDLPLLEIEHIRLATKWRYR